MNSAENSPSASPSKPLSLIARIYLFAVFYGSWVPLHFTPQPLADALHAFLALPFSQQSIDSATDWATNFLLLIPLTFLWTQRYVQKRQGFSNLAIRLVIIGLGIATAFALEFSQIFFAARTVSQKDIFALSLGAFVGVAAQYRWGPAVEGWFGMLWQRESQRGRLVRLLQVYLLVLFAFNVFPLDLTISPVELYHKWKEGKLVLVPFAGLKGGIFNNLYETSTDLLVWAPFGLFLTLDRKISLFRLTVIGWLVGAAIETAQLFVYSRVTDVTDILLAGLGTTIGGILASYGSKKSVLLVDKQSGFWFSLWAGWVVAIICLFWFPFDFRVTDVTTEMAWTAFTRMPFLMLYQGSELNAANEMLRKIGIFMLGGILWALGSVTSQTDKSIILSKPGSALVFATVAIVAEAGQLFLPGKYTDITDIFLKTAGALIGIRIGSWILAGDRSTIKQRILSTPKDNTPLSGFSRPEYSVTDISCHRPNQYSDYPNALLPQAKNLTLLDFIPLALASIGLSLLVGKENILTLPTTWVGFSIACLLALAISSRFPGITIISYFIMAYALPRYTEEYTYLIKSGLFDWICLAGTTGWLIWCNRRKSWPMWKHPVSLIFFLFLAILALSWIIASWNYSYRIFPTHTPLLFLHALTLFLIASTLQLRIKSLVIWGLFLCSLPSLRWYLQSTQGIYLDNDISSFATLVLPIALVGGWQAKQVWIRCLFFAAAIAMLGIIGLAQNRASAISLLLSILYLFWSKHKQHQFEISTKNRRPTFERLSGLPLRSGLVLKNLMLTSSVLLIIALALMLLPLKEYQARFSVLWNSNAIHSTAKLDRETINERYALWSGGIDMAFDHPLIGVGPGNFPNIIGIYQIGMGKLATHNTFIAVAAESGFIGLSFFLMLILSGFRTLEGISNQSSILEFRGCGTALKSSIIAYITIGMFLSRHDQVFLYVILGLTVALNHALRRHQQQSSQTIPSV